jgi:hypothetical protein
MKEMNHGCIVLKQDEPLTHRFLASLLLILNSGLDNIHDLGEPAIEDITPTVIKPLATP